MSTIKLNYLTANEYYQKTLVLAKIYCPEWANYWPETLDTNTDPGLVLLKLFSNLAEYVTRKMNHIPDQRFLTYLSFMGTSLGIPVPASVALTFTTKTQADETIILANTAVSSTINPDLFFYIKNELQVLPLSIEVALFVNPDQDTFTDQTQVVNNDQSAFAIFDNQNSQPLNHMLLLGDNVLFAPSSALQTLQIILTGSHLYRDYFMQWFDDVGNPLDVHFIEDEAKKTLIIDFDPKTGLPSENTEKITVEQVLNNLLSNTAIVGSAEKTTEDLSADSYYWLAVEPSQDVRILKNYENILPKITKITCNTSGSNIAPQNTLYNSTILNSKNGVYPFSQIPQTQDAFYIGSNDVFNRAGANVSLQFSINPAAEVTLTETLTLAWEYWDGLAWQDLSPYITENTTNNFVTTGYPITNPTSCVLNFTCQTLQPLVIAGQENLWIRVRIAYGNYAITKTTDTTTQTIYYPPFIYSLTISYQFTTSSIAQTLIHNNFSTTNLIQQPYIPIQDPYASFYLGFQSESVNLVDKKLTLFFPIEQSYALSTRFNYDPAYATINWQYYDGYHWQELVVTDQTMDLNVPGIVILQLPDNWQYATLFGQNLLWIRFQNQGTNLPTTKGIYPNSVNAVNANIVVNETLGSSDGLPKQMFQFANPYILAGQQVAVIENKFINQDEFFSDEKVIKNIVVTEVMIDGELYQQVQWQEVDNFAFSTPTSRHYVLNHQTGILHFGDGVQGMIPPKGLDNVIAVSYQASLAAAGNSPANTINDLQTANSQIQTVTNHVASTGGSNGYALSTLQQQTPAYLRSYNRAVIQEDYSALAVAANPLVLRAATQQMGLEQINIYILPNIDTPKPIASYDLLQTVKQSIITKVFIPLQQRIAVYCANYVSIDVNVQCYATTNTVPAALITTIKAILQKFLDPRLGGGLSEGWNFGESLTITELMSIVQRIPGVASILSITANGSSNQVNIASDQLICAGNIVVKIY